MGAVLGVPLAISVPNFVQLGFLNAKKYPKSCFSDAYNYYNKKCWNLSDDLQFFHILWSSENLKKFIEAGIG